MAMYAFVIKDARQCVNMMNLVQVYEDQTLVEQRLEHVLEGRFDKRIVCGFLKCRFTVAEMNSFFQDFANCAGVALEAQGYFLHFDEGMDVQIGRLTIQNMSDMHPPFRKIINEFTDGKLLDEDTFYYVKHT